MLSYRDGKLYHTRTWGRVVAGDEAGCVTTGGYWKVYHQGRRVLRHVAVWELHHGPVPPGFDVDHKDSTPGNDWIDNLQLVTRAVNMGLGTPLLQASNKSGYNGVDWHSAKCKWRARCQHSGKSVTVGYYDTPLEAHDARLIYQERHGLVKSRRMTIEAIQHHVRS